MGCFNFESTINLFLGIRLIFCNNEVAFDNVILEYALVFTTLFITQHVVLLSSISDLLSRHISAIRS